MLLRVMAYKSARNCATLITPHPVWGIFRRRAQLPHCFGLEARPCLQSTFACTGSPDRDGLTPVRFTVVGSNPPEASSDRIELAFRAPCDGIGDPAVDVGFMPAAPVDADLDLRRERALGDLAVDGGPGQPGPGKNGSQANDTVWFAHSRAASCWLFLTASETRQGRHSRARKRVLHVAVLWRRVGGK